MMINHGGPGRCGVVGASTLTRVPLYSLSFFVLSKQVHLFAEPARPAPW